MLQTVVAVAFAILENTDFMLGLSHAFGDVTDT